MVYNQKKLQLQGIVVISAQNGILMINILIRMKTSLLFLKHNQKMITLKSYLTTTRHNDIRC